MTVATRIPDEVVDRARRADVIDVAKRLGARLKEVARHEFAGPCPRPECGGTDRFSVNSQKNIFHCRGSGEGGDAIALWCYVTGDSFAEAVCALTDYEIEGVKPSDPPEPQPEPVRQHEIDRPEDNPFRMRARKSAYKTWCHATPAGEIVAAYFAIRSIPFPDWRMKAIREVSRLAYWHKPKGEDDYRVIYTGPAMVAAITGPDGRFIGLHRTWIDLSRPNGKAEIFCPVTGEEMEPKKVLGSTRPGRIELRETREKFGASVVIGEGIETVLSYDAMKDTHGAALWSSIVLGNLTGKAADRIAHPSETFVTANNQTRRRKVPGPTPDFSDDRCLVIPAEFDRAILLGDGDSDPFTTRTAMRRAKTRHEAVASNELNGEALTGDRKREVEIDFAPAGRDWNDVLMRRGPASDEPNGEELKGGEKEQG